MTGQRNRVSDCSVRIVSRAFCLLLCFLFSLSLFFTPFTISAYAGEVESPADDPNFKTYSDLQGDPLTPMDESLLLQQEDTLPDLGEKLPLFSDCGLAESMPGLDLNEVLPHEPSYEDEGILEDDPEKAFAGDPVIGAPAGDLPVPAGGNPSEDNPLDETQEESKPEAQTPSDEILLISQDD
ncbi:MAG: hypothetical protein J5949_04145, partial [Oscillospiraceae bacterium]|nr:hypothetical protein [Oscillospiraceae bacterium]